MDECADSKGITPKCEAVYFKCIPFVCGNSLNKTKWNFRLSRVYTGTEVFSIYRISIQLIEFTLSVYQEFGVTRNCLALT